MQTIKHVPDVALTNIYGAPIQIQEDAKASDHSGESSAPKLTPAKISQRTFLITMASDPTCAQSQGKTGIDAMLYVQSIREEIARQTDSEVASRGYWQFEDDRAKGLREAAKKPTGQMGYAMPVGNQMVNLPHCVIDFAVAMRDMAPEPKQEAKQLNGSEKALPEAAQAS
jgi:hypothetical protein